MKKTILSFLLVALPIVASADAVEINGIYYNLVTKIKEAEVTSNPNKYTGAVTIPESVTYEGVKYSVTSIGDVAFNECSSLTSVIIPNSVKSIGSYAFQCCYGLSSVTIPTGVTTVNERAFNGCINLISISISNTVTSIGNRAFYLCERLTSVHISDLDAWCKISFGTSGSSNPLEWAHHLYLNGKEIEDLVFPNSITSIASRAFCGCTGLTSVTIGNNVTTIGNSAFYGCSNITSVTIKSSVTTIEGSAFEDCTSLPSITIPDNVTSIGGSAFKGCTNVTSVTLGSGVNSIGSDAIASCPNINDVYCYAEEIPSTGKNAFQGSYIEYATLHVPEGSVSAYSNAKPWMNFKQIIAIGNDTPPDPEVKKCATPTITYNGGKLDLSCETEGVIYVIEYSYSGGTMTTKNSRALLTGTTVCSIKVYAMKEGYEDSETVTKDINLCVGELGDINGDGVVDITDAVRIVNTLVGK